MGDESGARPANLFTERASQTLIDVEDSIMTEMEDDAVCSAVTSACHAVATANVLDYDEASSIVADGLACP